MSHDRDWDVTCRVYIGNIGKYIVKHDIEVAFSKYGPLRKVWVARQPPGFAFVEYDDHRHAENAVRGLDGTWLYGEQIRVEMSTARRPDSGWDYSCKVFVGLKKSIASRYDIEVAFSEYGPLKNIWISRRPPGYAFVYYDDPSHAENAVRGLNGTWLCGDRIRVEMSTGRGYSGGEGCGGGRGRRSSRSPPPCNRRCRRSRSRSRNPMRSRR